MTRDEFIDAYMVRSGLDPATRTPDGFVVGKHVITAVPCACGEDGCEGWAIAYDQMPAEAATWP